MDKVSLLKVRRAELFEKSAETRKLLSAIVDENSFVELDSYSFSKNEFYGEDVTGEGVVTGYATINDYPVYVACINSKILNGGLTYAGCAKMEKCLDKALAAGAPVMYLLSSKGVVAGEGVSALEGVAKLLAKMDDLRDYVPQFAVCNGEVLGQASLFAAMSDYVYYAKDACVAYASPLVLSAKSGKSVSADDYNFASAKNNGLASFKIDDVADVRESFSAIMGTLPAFGGQYVDTTDDENRSAPDLNQSACADSVVEATFDQNSFIELNGQFAPEVKTVIGRVGGYSVGAIVFDGGKDGVSLDQNNIYKIKNFAYYCESNQLPMLTFVNTVGIKCDMATAATPVLKNVADLVCALKTDLPKINVIYGKALGLGYTLFASKNFGADYSYAFANAKISLFDSNVGAEMEVVAKGGDYSDIKQRYEDENMDAMNAAKSGYVDNVIEPEFVRQYVISALQMLVG